MKVMSIKEQILAGKEFKLDDTQSTTSFRLIPPPNKDGNTTINRIYTSSTSGKVLFEDFEALVVEITDNTLKTFNSVMNKPSYVDVPFDKITMVE